VAVAHHTAQLDQVTEPFATVELSSVLDVGDLDGGDQEATAVPDSPRSKLLIQISYPP